MVDYCCFDCGHIWEDSDCFAGSCPECYSQDWGLADGEYYGSDGQPDEYTEWQDVYGGDDWDHGQYDEVY